MEREGGGFFPEAREILKQPPHPYPLPEGEGDLASTRLSPEGRGAAELP